MIYPTHYLICFFSLSILTLNYLSTCLFIHVSSLFFIFIFFFFFQAEDGIRDLYVTGVQTCALPIYRREDLFTLGQRLLDAPVQPLVLEIDDGIVVANRGFDQPLRVPCRRRVRSEVRRVGKECRSRWWADHEKKKKEEEIEWVLVRDR